MVGIILSAHSKWRFDIKAIIFPLKQIFALIKAIFLEILPEK